MSMDGRYAAGAWTRSFTGVQSRENIRPDPPEAGKLRVFASSAKPWMTPRRTQDRRAAYFKNSCCKDVVQDIHEKHPSFLRTRTFGDKTEVDYEY